MTPAPSSPGKGRFFRDRALFRGLAACLLVCVFSPAASLPASEADRQYAFAEHRLQIGDYGRAVDEFERFLFFFPEDARAEQALFEIGRAHLLNRTYRDAVAAFQYVIRKHPDTDTALRSHLMTGRALVGLGDLREAVAVLNALADRAEERPDIRNEAYYELAWARLEIAADAREPHLFASAVDEAIRSFGRITDGDPSMRLAVERTVNDLPADNRTKGKSPRIAGGLALIPGAGHLYCGRNKDALIAFVLNAALILASVEAFDNGQPAMGALVGVVGLGFYTGNVFSAVGAAYKTNRDRNRRFINRLKSNAAIRLSVDSDDARTVLRLDVGF